jgi:uncharacterized protein YeaO (DUF488 family)
MSVRIGRVYDAPHRGDGRRILVDRLWPRGMTKERASLDEWCREVAPSTALRKWYGHDPERFTEFRDRYQAELAVGTRAESLARLRDLAAKQRVLLLTAAKDQAHSEAAVLADLLRGSTRRH